MRLHSSFALYAALCVILACPSGMPNKASHLPPALMGLHALLYASQKSNQATIDKLYNHPVIMNLKEKIEQWLVDMPRRAIRVTGIVRSALRPSPLSLQGTFSSQF